VAENDTQIRNGFAEQARVRRRLNGGLWYCVFSVSVLIAGRGGWSAGAGSGAAADASHLTAPVDLQIEQVADPLAVAEAQPTFSWRVTTARSDLHSVSQSGFQVRVGVQDGRSTASAVFFWDSGRVQGDVSALKYSGPFLEPQRGYQWQVRAWDERGQPSEWSSFAYWTQAPEWKAQWIAADPTDEAAGLKPMPLLRKGFNLNAKVSRAILYVSGLGQYEARLNGSKVGDNELAPGWSDYRKTVFYDSYDVTAMLRTGENAVGIMLGNGMYRVPVTPGRYTKFTGTFGPPKCIVQLHIELATGKQLDLLSDGTWKTRRGPITFSSTYGGEDYDARREAGGWDAAGFDDAGWDHALVVDGPGGVLRPALAPPIRVMRTYAPTHSTEPKPGILVYDLGQNFAGWPEITASGREGSVIKLIPGELLNPDGTVSQHSSGGPQWFSYTLKGAPTAEKWHPRFSYYGFRYVQVGGASAGIGKSPDVPRLIALRGQSVHTSSKPIGQFTSSDDLLNRIHVLIVRAIENNSVSLFTDCPHREKLGWLEETHLLAPSLLYDFDLAGLYAATARNIADTQKQDEPHLGRVPEIAPQYVLFEPGWGVFDDSPEWGSAAVLAPWYVYQRDGNASALLSHLDVMRRYVDYLSSRANDNIVAYGLGDWYDIGPGEPGISKLTTSGVTATAIYYQDLDVVAKALALAGKPTESRAYAQKADAVRKSFNARFFDAVHHRYDKGSQTAQAMPLVVGMVPDGEHALVLDALIADIRTHDNHVTAGDVGFHYVVGALLDSGRSDVLYDMMKRTDTPSYGFQLTKGATALTEAWDADPNSSQDHFMLGHAEEWFYRGLGGIQMDFDAPASRRLVIHPNVVGKLAWVRSQYTSVWGPIESNWKRDGAETVYEITIPANAKATVDLDHACARLVTVNGSGSAQAAGVINRSANGNGIELLLGSGSYRIAAPSREGSGCEPLTAQ
jgi:alpha-L-rhamnosidase